MVKFAIVCASNQNRSMEAHHVLSKKGYDIQSFGTNSLIKIPGPAIDKPNVYPFGTTYEEIYQDLKNKDFHLYTQNGLLQMLERNRKIKTKPERFQESKAMFDVIISCEERCYDLVCEDIMNRSGSENKPVFIINFDIRDNHEDATIGARNILQLAQIMEESKDLESDFETIIQSFIEKSNFNLLYTVCFY